MLSKRLQDLTSKHVADMDRAGTLAIVPAGSMEQHGPHLPLGEDIFVAEAVVNAAIEKLGGMPPLVVLPAIPIGQSPEHMDFPGTISFRPETYLAVITDICACLARHGFRKIVFVNGHGGNTSLIKAASFQVRLDHDVHVFAINIWSLVPLISENLLKREAKKLTDAHGGELETSMMLAIDPALVHAEWAEDEACPKFARGRLVTLFGPVTVNWNSLRDVSPSGISGEPSFGSAEKGRAILGYLTDMVAEAIKEIAENW